MPAKGNQMVPNAHFHKDWKKHVRCWFNQPARKIRRRKKRAEKAAAIYPRPTRTLKPIVQCPTMKYNMKQRLGRGFTLEELKKAGIPKHFARTIGISVDHRRRNRSLESLQLNAERLKEYRSQLILFPTKKGGNKKLRAGEATVEERETAVQLTGEVMPLTARDKSVLCEPMVLTEEMKKYSVSQATKQARAYARLAGKRAKRAREAENEEGGSKPAK